MSEEEAMRQTQKKKIPIWIVGLLVGISCLAIGIWEGQLADIYRKAVMICLECIGVG